MKATGFWLTEADDEKSEVGATEKEGSHRSEWKEMSSIGDDLLNMDRKWLVFPVSRATRLKYSKGAGEDTRKVFHRESDSFEKVK